MAACFFIYGPSQTAFEQINNSSGAVTYLHHDQAGSTRLLTGSTGTVTGKCTYSAYGAPTCEGTATTPLGYDAQYTSSDTGLIYLRNRVYDPATAQFLTPDLLAAISGEPYSYTGNDPVDASDPTGLLFGIKLPSWEEAGEAVAGWGDKLTFGFTKTIREAIGDENVDTCSSAYQAGGDAGLATGLLIPGEDDAELAEGTTTLYRAVGDEEAADIAATGTYRVPPGGVEGSTSHHRKSRHKRSSTVAGPQRLLRRSFQTRLLLRLIQCRWAARAAAISSRPGSSRSAPCQLEVADLCQDRASA